MYESRMYECKEDARRSSGTWEYGIVKMVGRGIRDECDASMMNQVQGNGQ